MVLLGSKDENKREHSNKSLGNRHTSHDIQNGLLEIMVQTVLPEKTEEIRKIMLFSIMGENYSDISSKEQLSLSLRSVKENLEAREDFLEFCQLTVRKSETTVNAVKDALLRFNLRLNNCRGQI